VGLRSVPIGRSGGCVFAVRSWWGEGAEGGAGAGCELSGRKTTRGAGPVWNLLPSRWNQIGWCESGSIATPTCSQTRAYEPAR
jgi:hypothetical protein